MRILHCCLANFYIDNFGYQENILPKVHKFQGHEVQIVASTETYIDNIKLGYVNPSSYFTKEGIPITRLPYTKWLPSFLGKKIRLYKGLDHILNLFQPEVIFIHDCQFLSIKQISNYAKRNRVKIYVDGHTDFINSARNWLSKNILHKVIYKTCAKIIEGQTEKFYGTLPLRCQFFQNVYGIDKRKIELLPFGIDDTSFDYRDREIHRTKVRHELGITDDDFVIITGGKIDRRKNIHHLLRTVIEINNERPDLQIKVIVFGRPTEELKDEVLESCSHSSIIYIEWLHSSEIFKYFFASDLAVFPGTHSVLWEEAIGSGLPCIFKRWEGIDHVDLGGNCFFIESGEIEEIKSSLLTFLDDKHKFLEMKEASRMLGPERFSYSKIALKAIS